MLRRFHRLPSRLLKPQSNSLLLLCTTHPHVTPAPRFNACLKRTHATCSTLLRSAAKAAGAVATAAGLLAVCQSAPCATAASGMTHNLPLAARHRVVLTQWPALEDPENGITTIESVFEWASRHGYDALEFSVDDFKKKFFPRASTAEVISHVNACVARYNLPTIGALYHVPGSSRQRSASFLSLLLAHLNLLPPLLLTASCHFGHVWPWVGHIVDRRRHHTRDGQTGTR